MIVILKVITCKFFPVCISLLPQAFVCGEQNEINGANGLCLSKDEQTLYVSEYHGQRIVKFGVQSKTKHPNHGENHPLASSLEDTEEGTELAKPKAWAMRTGGNAASPGTPPHVAASPSGNRSGTPEPPSDGVRIFEGLSLKQNLPLTGKGKRYPDNITRSQDGTYAVLAQHSIRQILRAGLFPTRNLKAESSIHEFDEAFEAGIWLNSSASRLSTFSNN